MSWGESNGNRFCRDFWSLRNGFCWNRWFWSRRLTFPEGFLMRMSEGFRSLWLQISADGWQLQRAAGDINFVRQFQRTTQKEMYSCKEYWHWSRRTAPCPQGCPGSSTGDTFFVLIGFTIPIFFSPLLIYFPSSFFYSFFSSRVLAKISMAGQELLRVIM